MMEPVAWAWRNNADEQFVATLDEPEICWEKQPLVRLSDAEARIAELEKKIDSQIWEMAEEAERTSIQKARAEAAEALLKEARDKALEEAAKVAEGSARQFNVKELIADGAFEAVGEISAQIEAAAAIRALKEKP